MSTVIRETVLNLRNGFIAVGLFGCLSFSFKYLSEKQELAKREIVEKKTATMLTTNTKSILLNKKKPLTYKEINSLNYEKEIAGLKKKVDSLHEEYKFLEAKNQILKNERDIALSDIENSNEYYEILKSTIKKGSKMWISNLKMNFLKEMANGNYTATNKAKNTDVIQISFTVNGSKITLPTDKNYYIQIIDSNNTIIGKREFKSFGSMTLEYSDILTVMYFENSVEAKADIQTYNLEKGNYSLFVFDNKELVAQSTFSLK